MAKKKYVEEAPVAGIGPDVDINSLPTNTVTDVVHRQAATAPRQADPALLRAGVKDPYLPSTPLNKETSKLGSGDPEYKREASTSTDPFRKDAPAQATLKSMSHAGTVREKR
jgi:hypothetical protein